MTSENLKYESSSNSENLKSKYNTEKKKSAAGGKKYASTMVKDFDKLDANTRRRLASRKPRTEEGMMKYVEKELKREQEPEYEKTKYLPNIDPKLKNDPVYSRVLRNVMTFWNVDPVLNDEQLCERIAWYFETCAETGQLATVEKLGLALGYERNWVNDIVTGKACGFSNLTSSILKKALGILASMDGELAMQSKIQPVVYLFRSKNFYGMSDKQEVVLTPNNPLGDTPDPESIEEKYKQLPTDVKKQLENK